MKSKIVFAAIAFACAMGLSLSAVAQDVGKKTDINLDYTKGKKGAVKFSHKKHATEYKANGKAIPCKECHHTLAKATAKPADVKKCTACHVAEGKAQVEFKGKKAPFIGVKKGAKFDKKSLIFHKNCLDGCHKKVKDKNIKKCKNCHVK